MKTLDLIVDNPVASILLITLVLSGSINLWSAARAGDWSRFREVLLALGPDLYRAAKALKTTPAAALAKNRASLHIDAIVEAGEQPTDIIIESVDRSGNTSSSVAPPSGGTKSPRVPPLPVFLALAVGLAGLIGCGAATETLRVVRVSSEVIAIAEPCLVTAYELEQRKCLELVTLAEAEACVARVRAAWDPIEQAFTELRAARCAMEPAKCAASEVQ